MRLYLAAVWVRWRSASRIVRSSLTRTFPTFARTHANGHAGELVMGYLAGLPVVILQGRAHRYEGIADHQARYPVRCMHAWEPAC
ncbi:MAG: hypothetical protein R3C56_09505 [Pirellulaceae bacterium]